MDFFSSVGGLGLGSRLKRLSDLCMAEVKQIYQSAGFDFEPRWFPLFSLLQKRGELTVTEAASELGITHPHISQIAKEMVAAKIIAFRPNPADKRSRIIKMTTQGRELRDRLQPLWNQISESVSELISEAEPQFLASLERVESVFKKSSLAKTVKGKTRAQTFKESKILDYSPKLKTYFESLNREWLEKYFAVEDVDLKYFADPVKQIIDKGGDVFFAELGGKIVGTCSLIYDGAKLELAKMAVTESARGKGIGELLAKEAIRRAKKMKVKSLTLVTNSRLSPAVRLYEKLGFREIFRGDHPKYKRGDLVMEKNLL